MRHAISRSDFFRGRVRDAGFTLIELAISVTIVGVILAAGAQAYLIYLKQQEVSTTKSNVETVASTVANYLTIIGRYPCPASLTAQRGDPAYGHESTLGGGDCTSATLPPGVYVRTSDRSPIQYKSGGANIPGGPEQPVVRVGAIPFRELNLDESQTIDGYGDRIVYAVTERLATVESYVQDGGGIDVQSALGTSMLDNKGTAHFFIYSAGRNRAGAYSRDGNPVAACPGTFPENQNCAQTGQAIFASVQQSSIPGPGYFDDVVNYFTQSNIPLWQVSKDNPTSIREKPDGKVGLYHPSDMSSDFRTVVPGTTRMTGNILADSMYERSGTYYFGANTIAGTLDTTTGLAKTGGIGCPPNQYLVSIQGGKAICQPEIWAYCPSGQSARGIDNKSSGTLVCETPPKQCASQTRSLCGVDTTLASSPNGTSITITSPTASTVYTCNNGNWTAGIVSGVCDCAAALIAHPTYTTTSACGTGYGGTSVNYTNTYTFSCALNGYTSLNNRAAMCQCGPSTRTGTANCKPNPPYTGTYVTTQSGTCSNNVFSWGAVTPSTQPNSCVCTPTTVTSHAACKSGLTGTRTIETSYACPSGASTVTDKTQQGDCTCQPSSSSSYQACPSGYVANPNGIKITSSYSCTNGPNSAGTWTTTTGTNDCIVPPPKQCSWAPLSAGSTGQTTGIGPAGGSSCSCGGSPKPCSYRQGANSYINYPSCYCQ